jgi:RNA polymerase sigma-70 factor (ECF subfamily)
LILSDVLDWPAREVAELLKLSVSAVNSALHRARATLARQGHGRQPESAAGPAADERTQRLLQRYVRAWETADVAGLVALLKEDAAFSMPPSPSWYRGPAAIAAFVAATVFADGGMFPGPAAGRWRLVPTRANAQPAFAVYQRMEGDVYDAFGIHVLAFAADQLAEITSFIDASLPVRFGLPQRLSL